MATKLGMNLTVGDVVADYGKLTFVQYDAGSNDVFVERLNNGQRDTWPGSAVFTLATRGVSQQTADAIAAQVADVLKNPEAHVEEAFFAPTGPVVRIPIAATGRNVSVPLLGQ